MIRNHDRRRALIDCPARIVRDQYALNNDRPFPAFPDPAQVCPRHRRFPRRCRHINQRHRPLSGNNNVLELRHTAIEHERCRPTWPRENLRQVRDFRKYAPERTLSSIPFRGSRSRINGNHECRKSCFACALKRALCRFLSAHQIADSTPAGWSPPSRIPACDRKSWKGYIRCPPLPPRAQPLLLHPDAIYRLSTTGASMKGSERSVPST